MFFIVNKTKGTVTVGDLGLSLGPRQAIDLDKIMKREKSESSQSLKTATQKGDIEIRVKDTPRSKKIPNTRRNYKPDLGAVKDEIIGEMKDTMKELLKSQGGGGGLTKEDIAELLASLPKQETVIIRQEGEKVREDEDVEMDEETLANINARSVNEIVKDTEIKSVHYEEKQAENTILDNVDELMDLL